jgi:hypothetical protein
VKRRENEPAVRRLAIIFFVALLTGCATTGRVDHRLEINKEGPEKITDVTLIYGGIRPIQIGVLGLGGRSWTQPMEVPEFATVRWTSDGTRHEETVPVREKAPLPMEGKIVSFEIHGAQLKVFIDRRLRDFKRARTQIYGP